MFAGDRRGLAFRLTEGQQVIAKGSVSVFERDGRYQLYVKEITLDGAGALYEKYEHLKRELAEEGRVVSMQIAGSSMSPFLVSSSGLHLFHQAGGRTENEGTWCSTRGTVAST